MFIMLLLLTICVCVCLFFPFCSSTPLAPFCSFVISYCLSCAPFFLLSSSCLSQYLPSLVHHPLPVSSLLVFLLMFIFSSPCFCHLPLDLLPLRIFSKIVAFWKHSTKFGKFRKFRWGPETPFLLWFQENTPNRLKLRKHPFEGCTRKKGPFFGTPSGRAVHSKSRKTSTYTTFQGRHPENTQFSERTAILMEKIEPKRTKKWPKKTSTKTPKHKNISWNHCKRNTQLPWPAF